MRNGSFYAMIVDATARRTSESNRALGISPKVFILRKQNQTAFL